MERTPDHVTLTLDGSIGGAERPGAMRWMPPEQAAIVRAGGHRALAELRRAAKAEQAQHAGGTR